MHPEVIKLWEAEGNTLPAQARSYIESVAGLLREELARHAVALDALRIIRDHASRAYPYEACGFITQEGVFPCTNVAVNRATAFEFMPSEVRAHEKRGVLGIYHSHCDCPATPSTIDLQRAPYFHVPYLIVEVRGGEVVHVNAYVLEGQPERHLRLANELIPC